MDLRLASVLGVVPEADGVTDLIEELFVTCAYHDVLQFGLTDPVIWRIVIVQAHISARRASMELLGETSLYMQLPQGARTGPSKTG